MTELVRVCVVNREIVCVVTVAGMLASVGRALACEGKKGVQIDRNLGRKVEIAFVKLVGS